MKKLLCVVPVLLLLAMIGAPNAHADSYTPTFSCFGQFQCPFGVVPTAPDVTFPSPTLAVLIGNPGFGSSYDVALAPVDMPTDTYKFGFESTGSPFVGPSGPEWADVLSIVDETTGVADQVTLAGGVGGVAYWGDISGGTLTFSPVSSATPEPAPIILMLLGAGLIFFMRKRFVMHTPRTA